MEQGIKYCIKSYNYSSFFCEKIEPLRTPKWEVKFIDQAVVIDNSKPKIPFNVMFNKAINSLRNTRIITRNIFIRG